MTTPLDALPPEIMPHDTLDWSVDELHKRAHALIIQRAVIEFMKWAHASEKSLDNVLFQIGTQNVTNKYVWITTNTSPNLWSEDKVKKGQEPHSSLNSLLKLLERWRQGPQKDFAQELYRGMDHFQWDLKEVRDQLPGIVGRSFEGGEQWLRRYWAQERVECIERHTPKAPKASAKPRI